MNLLYVQRVCRAWPECRRRNVHGPKEMLITRAKRSNWGISGSRQIRNGKIGKGRKDAFDQLGGSGVVGGRELFSSSARVGKSCIPRPLLSHSCGGW